MLKISQTLFTTRIENFSCSQAGYHWSWNHRNERWWRSTSWITRDWEGETAWWGKWTGAPTWGRKWRRTWSNIGHQEEDSAYVCKLQQVQQDLAYRNISTKSKAMLLKKLVLSLSASLRLWNIENDTGSGQEACHLPDQVPQKNLQHQMAAAWCCIVDKDRDRQGWNTWIKRARQAANNCQ